MHPGPDLLPFLTGAGFPLKLGIERLHPQVASSRPSWDFCVPGLSDKSSLWQILPSPAKLWFLSTRLWKRALSAKWPLWCPNLWCSLKPAAWTCSNHPRALAGHWATASLLLSPLLSPLPAHAHTWCTQHPGNEKHATHRNTPHSYLSPAVAIITGGCKWLLCRLPGCSSSRTLAVTWTPAPYRFERRVISARSSWSTLRRLRLRPALLRPLSLPGTASTRQIIIERDWMQRSKSPRAFILILRLGNMHRVPLHTH